MPATGAPKDSHLGHFYLSSLNSEGNAFDQGRGYFLPGRIQDPAEGLPGYAHLSGRLMLVQASVVSETDCLVFVHRESNLAESASRHPGWLEQDEARQGGDLSAVFWSGQSNSPTCSYEHTPISCQDRPHVHEDDDETYYFLSGGGTITLGEVTSPVGPGTVAIIPAGTPHRLEGDQGSELEFVIFGTRIQ